ncbi:protein kinase domain-containing protein [Ectobacillus panaciterrae]|uniref:protein kinase domain-containing protein n=1 Tax=Ectobacillus panaciterrae TaxID=363872 RepID=UPI00042A41F7|nr:serine/threonine protein kinase [Ectobacillus panaciterrae]
MISVHQAYNLKQGTIVQGKWNHSRYRIIKSLGCGATGIVYLAECPKGRVALKMSNNSTAIISEVNVLKKFGKVQGSILGPSLLDVDDWFSPSSSQLMHFYAMEYLDGENLFQFINKRGEEWLEVFLLQLLGDLQNLHETGWVFGDLKPDNVIIIPSPPKIRWLDVGGTTLQGRAIKEYTEFFDRGYWGLGSRKAEPSYDLFCVAMMIMNVAYPHRFIKKGDGHTQLIRMIEQKSLLMKYKPILLKAFEGKYADAVQMKNDLVQLRMRSDKRNVPKQVHRQRAPSQKKKKGIWETILLLIAVLIGYFVYIYTNLL